MKTYLMYSDAKKPYDFESKPGQPLEEFVEDVAHFLSQDEDERYDLNTLKVVDGDGDDTDAVNTSDEEFKKALKILNDWGVAA